MEVVSLERFCKEPILL